MNHLHPVIAELFEAINSLDPTRILAAFADDAVVADSQGERWGKDAIAKWVAKDFIGDRVKVEITDVIHHYGEAVVRARYDGEFDRTHLPADVILTHYFRVRDDKIVELFLTLYRG